MTSYASVTDTLHDMAPENRTVEAFESALSQAGISPEAYLKAV